LRDYLSKFIDFPIKTSLEEGQPRLLLTSVDIQDFTSPVVFDSYQNYMMPLLNAVQLSRERSKKAVVIVMVMMVVVYGIQNMVTQKVDMLYFMMVYGLIRCLPAPLVNMQ
jgi:hypothetical protein